MNRLAVCRLQHGTVYIEAHGSTAEVQVHPDIPLVCAAEQIGTAIAVQVGELSKKPRVAERRGVLDVILGQQQRFRLIFAAAAVAVDRHTAQDISATVPVPVYELNSKRRK